MPAKKNNFLAGDNNSFELVCMVDQAIPCFQLSLCACTRMWHFWLNIRTSNKYDSLAEAGEDKSEATCYSAVKNL